MVRPRRPQALLTCFEVDSGSISLWVIYLCHEHNLDFCRKELFCLFVGITNKMNDTDWGLGFGFLLCFVFLFH